jgi:sterol desaturase/sphingolipid hydroxylase (fatty acid hydroxylase superfamily)
MPYFSQHAIRVATLMCGIGLICLLEYWIAKKKNLSTFNSASTLTNFWILYINATVNFVFTGFITYQILTLVYQHGINLAGHLNKYLYCILLFILQDFSYYCQHRYLHECRWGWATHVTHHSSNEYNTSVTLRENPLSTLSLIWLFWLPAALLGFTPMHIIYMEAVLLGYQIWIHNELIGKLGFLETFLNTPSHHRVHHGSNPQYIDKNYGAVFIIWDKLFGTFEEEQEKPIYGITTPLTSNNPFYVMFHGWYELFRDAIHQKSFRSLFFMTKK